MSHEQIQSCPDVSKEMEFLDTIGNKYFSARFLEIYSLASNLLSKGYLDHTNFDGPVADLGTGSAIGLFTLRKFSPYAVLTGVDRDDHFSDRLNSYSGSYKTPDQNILKFANANFVKEDFKTFLRSKNTNSFSLITIFYSEGWFSDYTNIVNMAGKALKPGGQLLITTDWDYKMLPINWGTGVNFQGNKGEYSKTLIINTPEELKNKYNSTIKWVGDYLEDEMTESGNSNMGLIRDRNIHLFTKFNQPRLIKHLSPIEQFNSI